MKTDFKKSDLKSGMTVETRGGEKYLVITGVSSVGRPAIDCLVSKDVMYSWNNLVNYNDDLISLSCMGVVADIVKVFDCSHPFVFVQSSYKSTDYFGCGRLLWERKEAAKELTMQEIADKFGVNVDLLKIKK